MLANVLRENTVKFFSPTFQPNRTSKPSMPLQTPLKMLVSFNLALSEPQQRGIQRGSQVDATPDQDIHQKQYMKILKAVITSESPTSSLPLSPKHNNQHSILPKLSIYRSEPESSQRASTRAFDESLTKPTHEATVLTAYSAACLRNTAFQHRTHPTTPFTIRPPRLRSRRSESEGTASRRSRRLPSTASPKASAVD
jgi:hypothetical protein